MTARAVIQDYHLCLAPRLLAARAPGIQIAHFSHTPWAPPDYYRILPDDVGRQVLAGILGADHAGFLCRRWADSFIDCCEALLGADADRARSQVSYGGHVTSIGVHPLGVDAAQLRARAAQRDVLTRRAALTRAADGRKLIVRVDRTELSKNIVRGLEAYRELLRTRPEWHGKVEHLAFAYPSRYDLPEYREYTAAVERLAGQITDEFAVAGLGPAHRSRFIDDYPRSLAACSARRRAAGQPDQGFGMNLVAKEGPVLSDRGCALVLSTEAGAAAELSEYAIMVNPFDVSQTCSGAARGAVDERRRADPAQCRAGRRRRLDAADALVRRSAPRRS